MLSEHLDILTDDQTRTQNIYQIYSHRSSFFIYNHVCLNKIIWYKETKYTVKKTAEVIDKQKIKNNLSKRKKIQRDFDDFNI